MAGSKRCFVPKEKHSENIKQSQTISLLSVEGKISFAILARRLTTYMTNKTYIDSSVQKGGIPGFSWCVEHTSALTQLLHEARINHKNLTLVWLDLANAYGSIPHQLIQEALKHYHGPEQARSLIRSYYSNIRLRFSCKNYTTSYRGFMDDLTITTESHIQARWILKTLDETVTWARMVFKRKKSRFLVVKNGKVTRQFKMSIHGEEIPSMTTPSSASILPSQTRAAKED